MAKFSEIDEESRPGEAVEQMRLIQQTHTALLNNDLDGAESILDRVEALGRVGRRRLASRLD